MRTNATRPSDRNDGADEMRRRAEVLAEAARKARVLVSMPVVPGVTPRILLDPKRSERHAGAAFERRHGTFAIDEIGLSCFDHLGLYGDGCFEGILIANRRVFLFKEHVDRFWASARQIEIEIPYTRAELAWLMVESARQVDLGPAGTGYIRLVVSRGMGDLGINPRKCVAPTLFSLTSTIRLYPREMYETGIEIGLARHIRRPHGSILDPRIKSNNYLNNVLALIEGTRGTGALETLMLTPNGFIAEATVDNFFLIERRAGWEHDPAQVVVRTPRREYCLNGITRALILRLARAAGNRVDEEADLLPLDLAGPDKECFITGTGAGVLPIVKVADVPVGDGRPGPISRGFVERARAVQAAPEYGLDLDAPRAAIEAYLDGPGTLPEESARYRAAGAAPSTSPSPEYA